MPYSYMLASCQDYQIRQQGEVTWEQGPIKALASITLQRNLISTTCWGISSNSIVGYAVVYILRLIGHTHDRESSIQNFSTAPKKLGAHISSPVWPPKPTDLCPTLLIYVVTLLQHSNPSRVREMRAFWLEAIIFTVSVPPFNSRYD